MNYIVFDLEWNQSPIGQAGEHPRMPFEIIEIGAVKVNDKLEIVDEFQRLIRPKLYPTLHKYIRDILSYDEKVLKKNGVPFKQACTEFLEWCGSSDSYIFCTWGPSDLHYLQTNMDFYRMDKLPFPLKFCDIQQIYAEKYTADHSVSKLEKAVNFLKIESDRPFHAAVNDAYYTARVLASGKFGDITDKYTFDVYRHPKSKDEEIVEYHNKVLDHISGEYETRADAMADAEITSVKCSRCGRKTARKIDWFQNSNGTEYAVGKCFRHGNMLASLKFKPASDSSDRVFAIKKIVPISKMKYREIKARRDALEKKRKEKYLKYQEKLKG